MCVLLAGVGCANLSVSYVAYCHVTCLHDNAILAALNVHLRIFLTINIVTNIVGNLLNMSRARTRLYCLTTRYVQSGNVGEEREREEFWEEDIVKTGWVT